MDGVGQSKLGHPGGRLLLWLSGLRVSLRVLALLVSDPSHESVLEVPDLVFTGRVDDDEADWQVDQGEPQVDA